MKAILLCSFAVFFAFSTQSKDIIGTWKLPEDNTEVEIKKEGESYVGFVTKSDKKKGVGIKVLHDLVEKDGKYVGKLYAAKKDRLVDVEITPKGDELDLEVSSGWMSKTISWTRAK